jgi:hypothetical protein
MRVACQTGDDVVYVYCQRERQGRMLTRRVAVARASGQKQGGM